MPPLLSLDDYVLVCISDIHESFQMTLDYVLAALWTSGSNGLSAGQQVDIVVWSLELMGYVRSLTHDDQV